MPSWSHTNTRHTGLFSGPMRAGHQILMRKIFPAASSILNPRRIHSPCAQSHNLLTKPLVHAFYVQTRPRHFRSEDLKNERPSMLFLK
ncbi:hypothetical protein SBA5_170046 [Candidatus Sulfotelmatomonas gaucii]|uniref:Uncharacterized protein n=1 Tax=Candidatus Sulfuritelmatomonas gaucii TaxID=2043161 RepID=A0A2N9L671_9BACT|nr:hypothetical protein SBA5_170046 [Candidatus Sulfotelmatomonas gaucii]